MRKPRTFRRWWPLIQLGTVVVLAGWAWTTITGTVQPGSEDRDTALIFAGITIVAVIVTEYRVQAALESKASVGGRRRGFLARVLLGLLWMVWPLVTMTAAWTSIGWAPGWYIVAAGVVLPVLAGWDVARRTAASKGADIQLAEAWPALRRGSAVIVAGLILGGATGWMLHERFGPQGWGALAGWFLLAGAVTAGRWVGATLGQEKVSRDNLRGPVAAALGTTETVLDTIKWRVDRSHVIHLPGPLPATVITRLDGLDARIAGALPTYEVKTAAPEGIVLVPVSTGVREQRDLLAETEGYVAAEALIPDPPAHRPDARLWTLTNDARAPAGAAVDVQARKRGLSVVHYEPEAHEAVVAALDPDTRLLRDRIADALRVKPWEVELTIEMIDGRVDVVDVVRAPVIPAEDRRIATWRDVIQSIIPGGSEGWEIEDHPVAGRIVLRWGQKPQLPASVSLTDLLPATHAPDAWAALPLGVGADREQVGIDLGAGPHALIAGPTGSGKTVALLTLVTGALARGHRLVVIDPTKAGLDFLSLRPWATAWGDTLGSARRAMELVYEEVGRRKRVLQRVGEVKWSDVPADVRGRESLVPLTVLIDEYGSLAIEATIPKSMPRDHPLVLSATEENEHRAVVKELLGRIAREARFVGVHLQLALQRPDVAIMGSGELRSNLTSRIQLAPPGLSVARDAFAMLFDAEMVAAAQEQIALLDDGSSRGLAVIAAEGGTARGLRVGYRPMREIPGLLNGIGVPTVEEPWDLTVEESVVTGEPWNSSRNGTACRPAGSSGSGRGGQSAGRPAKRGEGNPFVERMRVEMANRTEDEGDGWVPPEEPPFDEPAEPWLAPTPAWNHDPDIGQYVPPTGQ
ncbi:FtsK/SpoIIIE domain-containing protein [Georgenia yuyongxinii]|uniref:FtsK domain-containing protein n=1 Tax=Georgenia yuyongxinii TaxID=2589797 RepID=A0A552WU94_9MICO|nr:FtsK/SpoIIIE domain-containing protein [Georgenia yuyongxinii]TRW46418.1 hypothetical protein FJ693_05685 [Georgenia yuyongxinii]